MPIKGSVKCPVCMAVPEWDRIENLFYCPDCDRNQRRYIYDMQSLQSKAR